MVTSLRSDIRLPGTVSSARMLFDTKSFQLVMVLSSFFSCAPATMHERERAMDKRIGRMAGRFCFRRCGVVTGNEYTSHAKRQAFLTLAVSSSDSESKYLVSHTFLFAVLSVWLNGYRHRSSRNIKRTK